MKGSSTIGAVSVIAGHGRPELGTESGATFRKRDRPEPRPGALASMGMTTSTDADDAKRQNGLEHGPGRSALAMGFLPWRPGSAVEGRPENPPEALEKVRFAPGNSTATAAVAATMPDETGVSLPARWGGRRPASGPCAAAIVHAVARKIRQKRLKTFDSRPELLTATVAVAATMPDEAGLSRPARWDRRRPTPGPRPATVDAVARRIRRNPLKTFDSRPEILTATAAVAATMPGETGMSLPAPWGRRRPAPGPCAAAIVHVVARKIRRNPLKTLDSRPEIGTRRRRHGFSRRPDTRASARLGRPPGSRSNHSRPSRFGNAARWGGVFIPIRDPASAPAAGLQPRVAALKDWSRRTSRRKAARRPTNRLQDKAFAFAARPRRPARAPASPRPAKPIAIIAQVEGSGMTFAYASAAMSSPACEVGWTASQKR